MNGIHEVRGSIPLVSTNQIQGIRSAALFLFRMPGSGQYFSFAKFPQINKYCCLMLEWGDAG